MFRIFNLIMLLAAFGSGICGVCARSQEAPKPAIAPQSPLPPDTKPVSHWDTKNALVVPFEYDPAKDNSPAVWLRINDSKPQLFIVDTGVYLPFILDAGSAATMQIVYPAKEVEVGGSKYSRLDGAKITWRFPATKTSAAKDVPLPLASLTGEPLLKNSIFITAETQGVIAETMGEYSAPIVGIIGGGFLRQAYGAVQFDFVCREMTLYPKTVPPLRVPGAATVPMHLKDVYNAIFVLAGNGSLHEMIVDTGAYEVVIPDALAGEFSMLNMTHESGTGPIIGGTSESFQCLLPQLRIGSLIEKDIKAEREVKGLGLLLLGMNFFSRFRVTLDYTHNELTLERAANYLDRSRAPGAVDFLVEMQNGVMRVTLVDSDGGAAKAGVKEGDILLEINGMATQKMTDAEAMLKMKGAKGETIKAVLQRPDGKKICDYLPDKGLL